MLFEGCQGKKSPEIQEKLCPGCGNPVELISTEVYARCEVCGTTVYSDLMDCLHRCPKARECMGDECYSRMLAARSQWQAQLAEMENDDEW